MTQKKNVVVPISFDPESLVYCREVASMQGKTLGELIEGFIDEGMRRLARDDEGGEDRE